MASMDGDHPAAIDHRPPRFPKSLAAPRRTPLDLQEVRRVSNCVIMVWLIAFPIIWAAVAFFMWQFERHLEDLTGPWIPDSRCLLLCRCALRSFFAKLYSSYFYFICPPRP